MTEAISPSNNQLPQEKKGVLYRCTRALRVLLIYIALPLLVLIVSAYIYLVSGGEVTTDNAFIRCDKIPLSSEVDGIVTAVHVVENQFVNAEQLLITIDSERFDLEYARAKAQLELKKTELRTLQAKAQSKQAEIEVEKTRYQFQLKEQKRQADLVTKGFSSTALYEAAQQLASVTAQTILVLEQELVQIKQSLGGEINTPIELHPTFLLAQAEVEQAQLNLAKTKIYATTSGVISFVPQIGEAVSRGKTLLVLVSDTEVWVEANIYETDLAYVKKGQSVKIRIDSFPEHIWQGKVNSISPATGSEFAIIPPQNATGNWVKVTQRVPLRISLAPQANQPSLHSGLSAHIAITTGHKRTIFGWSL